MAHQMDKSELFSIATYPRNHHWAFGPTGLVARLKQAQEPICIVVGALHCMGSEGLVNIFRSNGFVVQQI